MPSKKYLELQDFTTDDLKSELDETVTQYQKLNFDHTIKGLDNPLRLREVRRDIARIKTELKKRQLSQLTEEQLGNRTKIRARRRK